MEHDIFPLLEEIVAPTDIRSPGAHVVDFEVQKMLSLGWQKYVRIVREATDGDTPAPVARQITTSFERECHGGDHLMLGVRAVARTRSFVHARRGAVGSAVRPNRRSVACRHDRHRPGDPARGRSFRPDSGLPSRRWKVESLVLLSEWARPRGGRSADRSCIVVASGSAARPNGPSRRWNRSSDLFGWQNTHLAFGPANAGSQS